ncbi:MAG: hypothetical protein ABFD46_12365 [Armatimonadota bacterium]
MRKTLLLLFLLIAAPAMAQLRAPVQYSLLSESHGDVELGWYASSDEYKYIADVNLAFDFGSWKDARFNFRGGILTLVKTTDDDNFQPDRYRGTLEPAVYLMRSNRVYSFSIRHQSFHTIDREPVFEESYELYNVSYQLRGQPNLTFAVGKYMNTADVDYNWDLFAEIDTSCIGSCRYGRFYTDLIGHYVDEDGDLSSRSSFFDYNIEAGIQTEAGVRYFTAYRVIHDINQFDGITDHQWVFGLKYIW